MLCLGYQKSAHKNKTYHVRGTSFRPVGLIERIRAGRAQGKPMEALNDPDPNNCIFLIIDRVEYETFNDLIDARYDKLIPINENRFFVLDGWLKENFLVLFANFFNSPSSEDIVEAREVIIRRMNSLISPELKDHVYAVARSSRIL